MKEWLLKQKSSVVRLYVWMVLNWEGGKWERYRIMEGAKLSDKTMYYARRVLLAKGLLAIDENDNFEVVNIFCKNKSV